MAYRTRAADAAKSLLGMASNRLMTPNPAQLHSVSSALDKSLDWTVDDAHGDQLRERPFEPSFSETAPKSLAFQVRPSGRGVGRDDQREISTQAMRQLVGEQFGRDARHWLDGRTEAMRGDWAQANGYGAMYALGFDENGLNEAAASYEWGPHIADTLPEPLMALARIAVEQLPGLRPFYTTIRCGRASGGQQMSFAIDADTRLDDLAPLMRALGLGERHGGLRMLVSFVLGARFVLPAGTSVLTVLNSRNGPELRLDVNIDALPDVPEQLLPLLRLPMTERPQNLAALDRWMTAMTPDGFHGPGAVTVLSVRVRRDMPARLALYLRPVQFESEASRAALAPAEAPTPVAAA